MTSRSDKPGASIAALPELATINEVAAVLRCAPNFVYVEIAAGRLGASKIAGRYLVPREAVPAYVDQQKVQSKGPAPAIGRLKVAASSIKDPTLVEPCADLARKTGSALRAAERRRKD